MAENDEREPDIPAVFYDSGDEGSFNGFELRRSNNDSDSDVDLEGLEDDSGGPAPGEFVDDDLCDLIVEETNRNARQTLSNSSELCRSYVPTVKLSLNVYSHFYLAVKPAHKLNSLSSNQTVLQGNDATFNCLTEAFPTATTYRWFKDGNRITNSANFEIFDAGGVEESRLTIKKAQKGTAGQYSCDGTNGVGTGERKTAFLLVNYKPRLVTVTPDPADVELGQSITLTCEADGFPKPSYSWKFNGAAIGDRRNTLQLASAQVLNTGNYTCMARNSFGSAEETRM
ncbi:carcinoembryonic antigen-related cell adhesion molecule 16-like, partial [Stylophora pistillata]|uniref:carcinoembryonic antigen-related cell adhesion molecule 16-like n=1 Tax=Stylophora pistillata TaxID=50429 RepID=UPI000C04D06E